MKNPAASLTRYGIFVFVFAISIFSVTTAHAATNLIANPSLETAGASASVPASWTTTKTGNNTASFVYPVTGSVGKAAQVTVSRYKNGEAAWYFVDVPVTASSTYSFSESYKATVQTSVRARFTLTNNAYTYVTLDANPGATSVWKTKTYTLTAPAQAKSLTILHSLSRNGQLTVDEYSLFDTTATTTGTTTPPVATSTNLVTNSAFESASGGNPVAWARGNWGTNTTSFSYPVAGRTGNAAQVSMSAYTDGDAKWYFTDVPVTPGSTYIYSDYYTSTVTTQVAARYLLSSGSYMYVDFSPGLVAAAAWSPFSYTFIVPANAVSMTVFHMIRAKGALTLDDVSISPVGTSTPNVNVPFAQGMVSLDFDDGWLSTYQNGLPILDAAGLKSTQYIISDSLQGWAGYAGKTQVLDMQNRGHEIGSHTKTHPELPLLTPAQMQNEIIGSKADLEAAGVSTIKAFAYPYGEWNSTTDSIVKSAGYLAARTSLAVDQGFNYKDGNHFLLKTQSVKSTTPVSQITAWIDQAIANKTWLVLMFHKVQTSGDDLNDVYWISPANLQQVVDYLISKNVMVVTASQGAAMMNQ